MLASGTDSQVLLTTAGQQEEGFNAISPSATGPAGPTITLNLSTPSADILKVQALGNYGTLLIGHTSTLSASGQLLLYAGNGSSSGLIEFVSNARINNTGTTAGVLAAYTIRLDNDVQVTISGPAVRLSGVVLPFTGSGGDGTTTGRFTGSGAVTIRAYGSPGTPTPSASTGAVAVTPRPSSTSTAAVVRHDPVIRREPVRTVPFAAVQPYLVRGGAAMPAALAGIQADREHLAASQEGSRASKRPCAAVKVACRRKLKSVRHILVSSIRERHVDPLFMTVFGTLRNTTMSESDHFPLAATGDRVKSCPVQVKN